MAVSSNPDAIYEIGIKALQDEGSKMDDPESKKQLLGFKVCF